LKVDFEKTLSHVISETPRLEDETDSQYAARVLHLAFMVVEHGEPIYLPEEKEED
jgi:hypothetical protein